MPTAAEELDNRIGELLRRFSLEFDISPEAVAKVLVDHVQALLIAALEDDEDDNAGEEWKAY